MNNKCCTNCFSEFEIINFIESEEIIGDCDYCNSRNVSVCDVVDVGSFIMEGVERHYEDAANQVGYDSSEGGYLLPTQDIAEILLEEDDIFGESLDDPYPLLEDLVSNDGTPYVRKDPYGPPSGDPEEIRYWGNFCKTVKTKQRFTAFLSSADEDQYGHSQPKNFLFHLAHNFMPTLIDVLQPQTKIYRARINNENREWLHKDLTSPPPQRSRSSRMSPAGISFFYGGLTPEVCINEVHPSVAENVMVAEFEVIKRLFVLNLATVFEARRSIFHPEYSFSYEEYFKPFLEHFVGDISKPIRKTDNEIEYVPTQVFTEFIKAINFKANYYLPDSNGNESDIFIDGVLFKSSVMKDGINLVLFRGPEISTTDSANSKDAWLFYEGKKTHQITEIIVNSVTIEAQPNA
jgi:hypothetical protein